MEGVNGIEMVEQEMDEAGRRRGQQTRKEPIRKNQQCSNNVDFFSVPIIGLSDRNSQQSNLLIMAINKAPLKML